MTDTSYDKFYMVLRDGVRGTEPTYRHQSLRNAHDEADRLARQQPGVTFFVLEAIESCQAQAVLWTKIEDMPF